MNTITAMSLTNGTLTVVMDNGSNILTARNDHPKWNDILEAYKNEDAARLSTLLSLKAVVEEYSVGALSINSTGVTYNGRPVHTLDSQRVMAFLQQGLPYKPIANYIARKAKNPSSRAITEMYNFLEHKNMPLTPNGTFIAYKGVKDDYWSVTGNPATVVLQGKVDSEGRIFNGVGEVIEIERSSCDDDYRRGCSAGLHAGSLEYALGWSTKVVLVEIDPADVVSVPDDCNCAKLRCCKYKVIGEYTGPLPEAYTNEFSKEDDESFNDDCCDECGSEDCSCEWNKEEEEDEEDENTSGKEYYKACPDSFDAPTDAFDDLGSVPDYSSGKSELEAEAEAAGILCGNINDAILTGNGGNTYYSEYMIGHDRGNYAAKMLLDPEYIEGDQFGADSDKHHQYIQGYIDGYTALKSSH